jgi:hypothetical protein
LLNKYKLQHKRIILLLKMPVTTRSRERTSVTRDAGELEHIVSESSHSGPYTTEESALNSCHKACGNVSIGNEPISNIRADNNGSAAPTLMLLQQHMEGPDLRELIGQLSDNQSSMMGILQSLIETNSGGNLNSL